MRQTIKNKLKKMNRNNGISVHLPIIRITSKSKFIEVDED